MWLEAIPRSKDHSEKCPTCGGAAQRRQYGEMYAGSSMVDGNRVEICRVPDAGYADPIVLDPLCQYFDGGLYRRWPKERYFARGGKYLHRDVWAAAFGPIPDGCHIHHRDGNSVNNCLSNLECLPAADHLSAEWKLHAGQRKHHFTAAARGKASEWHRSEVGRAWHRRHARRTKSWTKWKRVEKPCHNCGELVEMLERAGNAQKYCSETCKALAYRKRDAAKRAR